MHEATLLRDLMREILEVAAREGATRVTAIHVRLGDLSHLTPEHFEEHFVDASRGTLAEGAAVHAAVSLGPAERGSIVLESVEVED